MDDPLTHGVERLLNKYSFELFKDIKEELKMKSVSTQKLFKTALKIKLYEVLNEYNHNIRQCARSLKISYPTLYRLIKEKRKEERRGGQQE
jgi:transcriptional regulator of acetoin/glycerol metabolism